MAFIIKDRVKENTATTGTGVIALSGAAATFDTFSSYMSNGDTTYYAIVHGTSGVDEWEVGLGTWSTDNTITRTTVLSGSNGTTLVNLSAGAKEIFMTYPADKAAIAGESISFANITVTGTVDGRDIAADGTKLDAVEASADVTDTTNVTAAGALMDSEVTNLAEVKAFDSTDYATAAQGTTADAALPRAGGTMTGDLTVPNIITSGAVDGRDVSADGTKLDGIETGATADQTAAQIKTAYESNANTNEFSDAEQTKLAGIEANATADQTAAEIKTAYESNADTNEFSDAEQTKLAGIETSADVTDATNVAAAGAAMTSNNLSDLASTATARTNLDVDQAGTALAMAIALG